MVAIIGYGKIVTKDTVKRLTRHYLFLWQMAYSQRRGKVGKLLYWYRHPPEMGQIVIGVLQA